MTPAPHGGRETFAPLAKRYDGMNAVLSLGLDSAWRGKTLELALSAAARSPRTVLDIACGTGDFALEARRRMPSARITGLDITPEMLAVARGKVEADFEEGDACDLSRFPDGAFDMATCAFGFRNFQDRRTALAEAHRVLAPGGVLAVLELFRPRGKIAGAAVSAWIAVIGRLFAHTFKTEYRYLRDSIGKTVSPDEFASLAAEAGFRRAGGRFFFPGASAVVLVK